MTPDGELKTGLASSWKWVTLGEVGTVRYGLGQPPRLTDNGVPMLRATNIKRGTIVSSDLIRVSPEAIPEGRNAYLKEGEVIVVRSGAYTGDAALVTREWAGAVAGYDLVFSPSESMASEYVAEALLSDPVQAYFHGERARSAQPHINRHQLEKTVIPLPPRTEQRKIAEVLGLVRRAIDQQERLLALTAELKRALLHQIFTRGLSSEPPKETEIGRVPKSWIPTTLGAIATEPDGFVRTGPFGSQLHKGDYVAEGVGVVNPTHLWGNQIGHENIPYVTSETASRLVRHTVEPGDSLFGRRGEIGRHGIVSLQDSGWLCGTGCFLVRIRARHIDSRFLSYQFSTPGAVAWLNSHAAGAIMPNLSNAVLQAMPVFHPPVSVQTEIADCLDAVSQRLAIYRRKQAALSELFRILLHQLMTAQIRVHDLDLSEIGIP